MTDTLPVTQTTVMPPDQDQEIQAVQVPELETDALVRLAINKNLDTDKLERLIAMKNQQDDRLAKKAFNRAMAAFRAECPRVVARHENAQFSVNKNGVKQARRYASLDDVAKTIDRVLPKFGLSYRWSDVVLDDQWVRLSCEVTHEDGHSESSAVSMPWNSKAGCSESQKVFAATTYAQRSSLCLALGLVAGDEDDNDGNEPANAEKITEGQARDLLDQIEATGTNTARFASYFRIGEISDLPASEYDKAVSMLEEKVQK